MHRAMEEDSLMIRHDDDGGTDIEELGSVTAKITVRVHTSSVKFFITDTLSPNILSYKDSMKLQLVNRINSHQSVLEKTVIIDKYPHVFSDDLVSLPGEYTIQLRPNTQPVQQPPRPVPVHLKNSYIIHTAGVIFFVGLFNYMTSFQISFSIVSRPLRDLMKIMLIMCVLLKHTRRSMTPSGQLHKLPFYNSLTQRKIQSFNQMQI